MLHSWQCSCLSVLLCDLTTKWCTSLRATKSWGFYPARLAPVWHISHTGWSPNFNDRSPNPIWFLKNVFVCLLSWFRGATTFARLGSWCLTYADFIHRRHLIMNDMLRIVHGGVFVVPVVPYVHFFCKMNHRPTVLDYPIGICGYWRFNLRLWGIYLIAAE